MDYQRSDNEDQCSFTETAIHIGELSFYWDRTHVYRDMAACSYCEDTCDHIGFADTWDEFADMVSRYLRDMATALDWAKINRPNFKGV
jgi:hypothetical protein